MWNSQDKICHTWNVKRRFKGRAMRIHGHGKQQRSTPHGVSAGGDDDVDDVDNESVSASSGGGTAGWRTRPTPVLQRCLLGLGATVSVGAYHGMI